MNPKKTMTHQPAIALCPDPEKAPTRTNYIFVDYENVQPDDLSRIGDQDVRVLVVVGEKQTKVPIELIEFLQEKPGKLEVLRTPCQGKNALDFVLASEVGRVLTEDTKAYIHIISKDTGFDALILHLRSKGQFAARHSGFDQIPILLTVRERLERLRKELGNPANSRPKKRATLERKIQSYFGTSIPTETAIKHLLKQKTLSISDEGKVSYL